MPSKILSAITSDTTSSTIPLDADDNSALLITIYAKGDFDGVQIKPRISPTGSAATWNVLTSAVLSADGVVNLWLAPDYYIDLLASAASTSTSVDAWVGVGVHTK